MKIEKKPSNAAEGSWTLLSNHAHVLVCLSRNPVMRLREVADQVGITERAVHRIVSDLETAGMLTRERDGRRNRYRLHGDRPMRHPLEAHCTVGQLLEMISGCGKAAGQITLPELRLKGSHK